MAIIKLTNQNANIITAGTFADARISNSSVSQHATSFDDNKIVNDLSTLGLRVHTQENLNASNTNSASFDVFQDSSAISNLTNTARDNAEFMSSVVLASESGGTTGDFGDISWGYNSSYITIADTTMNFGGSSYNQTAEQRSNFLQNNYWWSFKVDHSSMQSFSSASENTVGQFAFFHGIKNQTSNISDYNNGIYNNSSNNYYYINFKEVDSSEEVYFMRNQTSQGSATVNLVGNYITFLRETAGGGTLKVYLSSSSNDYVNGTLLHTFSGYSGTSNNGIIAGRNKNNSVSFDGQTFIQNSSYKDDISSLSALNTSATGSFTGNNITASSSTNKMGAVITYQDQAGTNALNTDIVLKLSADGGSNFTTATMTALPDFATGIKMAKVNDLSVTAGTQLKYKIEFANQASGSKEARIRGVSLQY